MAELQNPPWSDWETVQLIGRGSFGTVYEIQRKLVDDNVESAALKVITIPQNPGDVEELYSEGYDAESITATFHAHLKSIIAEYSLMRKMDGSANIVNCKDICYIQHDNGIGWDIYIRMELLTPLMKALPVDAAEDTVIRIGKDICKALVLCKKYEIIHRDIKPQNIFVSPNGDYKLGDFGIAKTVEKTMGGTKIGTYKYMAPEVYNNQPYGSAADMYSLGLVLYWLLNERRMPFMPLPPTKLGAGMDEEARLRRLSGEKLPPPVHGSEKLKQIVLKACEYDPKDRYTSAAAMLEELNDLDGSLEPIRTPSAVEEQAGSCGADKTTESVSVDCRNVLPAMDKTDRSLSNRENSLCDQYAISERDEKQLCEESDAPELSIVARPDSSVLGKKKMLLWGILCTIGFAAVLGLVWFLAARNGNKQQPAQNNGNMITVWVLTEELSTSQSGGEIRNTYRYDEKGNCLEFVIYDGGVEDHRVNWTYDENSNVATYTQTYDGEATNRIYTYTYDEKGNVVAYSISDDDDGGENGTYTYDEKGNIVKYVRILDSERTIAYEYTYDEQNNVIEEVENSASGSSRKTNEYDKNGNLTKKVYYSDGAEVSRYVYAYDQNGNETAYSYYDEGELQEKRFYVYDSQGKLLSEQQQQFGGAFDDGYEYIYTYNDAGNLIEKYSIGGGAFSDYRWVYAYDQNGNVVEEKIYHYGNFQRQVTYQWQKLEVTQEQAEKLYKNAALSYLNSDYPDQYCFPEEFAKEMKKCLTAKK